MRGEVGYGYEVIAHYGSDGSLLYSDCGWAAQVYIHTESHQPVSKNVNFTTC